MQITDEDGELEQRRGRARMWDRPKVAYFHGCLAMDWTLVREMHSAGWGYRNEILRAAARNGNPETLDFAFKM